ncbi:hypothetical protein [Sphingomonas ginsenosidimutans]|uniref:hypothetical protein n=1 Tax=Sphingomonas ginsenosidimutans TaxID=862134 RepID=UPI001DC339CD|nr:hypothetical protein [Sphingomonas ginsenosidimutans]MBY0300580.1 hypothetical protein [Sphingomonas ginsenosidimutans]
MTMRGLPFSFHYGESLAMLEFPCFPKWMEPGLNIGEKAAIVSTFATFVFSNRRAGPAAATSKGL